MARDPVIPFTDYRSEGDGYYFKKPDGKEQFFYGDDADRIASMIDQQKPKSKKVEPTDLVFSGDRGGTFRTPEEQYAYNKSVVKPTDMVFSGDNGGTFRTPQEQYAYSEGMKSGRLDNSGMMADPRRATPDSRGVDAGAAGDRRMASNDVPNTDAAAAAIRGLPVAEMDPSKLDARPQGVAPQASGMPQAGFMPGEMHLDESIAPKTHPGVPRPFAPGEYVNNPDGSWSSEVSMTVQNPKLNGGKATVIPSMWLKDGKPYIAANEDEAAAYANASGLKFRSYPSIQAADKASVDREAQWQPIQNPSDARKIAPLWDNASAAPQAPPGPQGNVAVGPIAMQNAPGAPAPAAPQGYQPKSGDEIPTQAQLAGQPMLGANAPPAVPQLGQVYHGAQRAGYQPKSMSVETAGGLQPEQAKAVRELYQKEADAQGSYYDAQIAQQNAIQQAAQETAANAQAKTAEYDQKVALENDRKRRMQEAYTVKQDAIMHEQEAIEAKGVDPHRLFRGQLGNTISVGIASFLGSLGQAFMARGGVQTPNYAMQMIDKKLDADIDAQKMQLQSGRITAGNRLAALKEKFGLDNQDAATAYEIAARNSMANQAMIMAAGQKSQDAQIQAKRFADEQAQKIRELNQDMIKKTDGDTVKSTVNLQWQPARSAGWSDDVAALEKAEKVQELRRKLANKEPLSPEEQTKVSELGVKMQGLVGAKNNLEQMVSLIPGAKWGPDGELVVPPGTDIPGIGVYDSRRKGYGTQHGENGRMMKKLQESAATNHGHMISGAALSPQDVETSTHKYDGATEKEFLRTLASTKRELEAQEKSFAQTYGPNAMQQFVDRGKGADKIERGQRTAGQVE